ncbi:MAG TPA: hypothetical protein VMS08_06170 [Candidatus Saccharimonadia bacterium]|nr:hypothetical protein [Candidatus Saccharimonadia bacterium]
MRNIVKLGVFLTLLATQVNVPKLDFGNVAAAAVPQAPAAPVYEVKLNTNTASPVVFAAQTQPNYDTDVLQPLHAAQAAEAAQAAQVARDADLHVHRVVTATAVVVTGSHVDWMREAGIAESNFGYVSYIIGRESGWGVTKWNRYGSGAYGLGQAMPATKMAAFGPDYLTNPVTQLRWANAYAVGRYGSWARAYSHWLACHSW